jgi:hypothetical protein
VNHYLNECKKTTQELVIGMDKAYIPSTLVRIRLYQLRRYAADLGPFYTVAIFLALCLISYALYLQYQSFSRGLVCCSAILMLILFIQTHRSDSQFVFHSIEHPALNIFAEYFLFSLPLTGPALFAVNWYLLLVMVFGLSMISRLQIVVAQRTSLPNLSRLVPPMFFEWISGIRKNRFAMGFFLALGVAFCWVRFFPFLFQWMITGVVTSFYQECEPMDILMATSCESPSKFLRSKIARHSKLLLTFILPLLVINAFFHPDLIWLGAIFAILQLTVLCVAILLKYSRYEPGHHLPSNSILVFLAFLAPVLPFLLPVSLFMSVRFFRIGTNNLRTYLRG